MSGQTFGRWTVLSPAPSRNGKPYLLCRCTCGTKREVRKSALAGGKSESCGCIRLNPNHEPIWTCHNGHRVTPANTYTYPKGNRRSCRICEREGTNRRRNSETESERKKAHYQANRAERREKLAIRRAAMTEEERRYVADNAAKWRQQMNERFPSNSSGKKFSPEEDAIIQRTDLSIEGMCAQLRAQGTPRGFGAVCARRLRLLNGGNRPPLRGELNPQAKLSANDVREIRASHRTQSDLAAIYGVNQSHISAIQLGKRWTHVN